MAAKLLSCLSLGVLLLAGCTAPADEENPAGPASTLTLSVEAQPNTLPADGVSRMVVFVDLRAAETPVADSTQVILLHSLGSLNRGIVYTTAGMALDTLTADSAAGTGWLIAVAGSLRDSAQIRFTPLP